MPTVKYKKPELRRLVGRKATDEQIMEAIALIKPNIEEFDDDTVTVEHTADRIDLFSVEGMARAVSSYLGFSPGLRKYSVMKPAMSVKVSNVGARPHVSAAVVRNVRMDGDVFEGLINAQELLNDSIGRGRVKAAIGVHDLDKIEGDVSYSSVDKSEKMVPLESDEDMELFKILERNEKGVKYAELVSRARAMPAFTDKRGIISFPPIINSDRTKVTQKTKNFFIEVTGTDRDVVSKTMAILVTWLAERRFTIEGVKMRYGKKTEVTPDLAESIVEIDVVSMNRLLGLELRPKDVIDLLGRMGYDALSSGEKVEVIVPPYRTDILHQVDVFEDVAIAYGYNNFESGMPNLSTMGGSLDIERTCQKASSLLVGLGFQEIMNSCLSNPADQTEKMSQPEVGVAEIRNPSSSDYSCVRASLLPGILRFLASNKHYEYPQNVFEVGDVVLREKTSETGYRNERRVAGVVCHSRAGFAEVRSVVEGLVKGLGGGFRTRECDSEMYIPGRGVDVYIDKRYVGSFGELHPRVIQDWDIGMPVCAFEMALETA